MKRFIPALLLLLPLLGFVSSAKFKASEAAAKDARALAASLSKDLDAARTLGVSLSKDLDAALNRTTSLVKDLEAEKARVEAVSKSESDLKASLAEAGAKLASASDQVVSLQKSVKDLSQSLEANKGELAQKVSSLVKEKDLLGQKLASTEAAGAASASAKQRELGDLTRAKAAVDGELAALKKSKAEADGELAAQKKSAEDLASSLAALKMAKALLEDEKAALQKQKDDEVAAVTKNYEGLAAGLKAEISAGEVTISSLEGKLTVNLVDRILFDSGSAEVKPAGRKILAHVGSVLNLVLDKDIRIEGHTDNVPISGELRARYPSNWELSTARATSVARYLQDHAAVDPNRLVAAGLGEWRPVAPNDKPESRALNRRIEIILAPRD